MAKEEKKRKLTAIKESENSCPFYNKTKEEIKIIFDYYVTEYRKTKELTYNEVEELIKIIEDITDVAMALNSLIIRGKNAS